MKLQNVIRKAEDMKITASELSSVILAIEQAIFHEDFDVKEYEWAFHLAQRISVSLEKDLKELVENIYNTNNKQKGVSNNE